MDEAWMEFMVTGKVDDYLRYRNAENGQMRQTDALNLREERPDGTEYRSDRDGLTGYADWRV